MRIAAFNLSLMALTSAHAADSESILINGPEVSLSAAEMSRVIGTIPEATRGMIAANQRKLAELVDEVYINKVMAHRAQARGLADSPEVKAAVETATRNALAVAEMQSVVAEKTASADFTQWAREYYVANADKFVVPEMVSVAHVLIPADAGVPQVEAIAELEKLKASLIANPASYADAVAALKESRPGQVQSATIGWISRSKVDPAFAEAAFALTEKGSVSDPVVTRFGVHLIRLDDRKAEHKQAFEEVQAGIESNLRKKREEEIRQAYINGITAAPGTQVNQEGLDAFLANPL